MGREGRKDRHPGWLQVPHTLWVRGIPLLVGESVALGWMRVTQAEIWFLLLPDRKHNHETA